jgi:ATP-binding cassette subfamily E protein 1
MCSYPPLQKSLGEFKLHVGGGDIREGEIIGIAGANATGKTTFVKLLAGELRPSSGKVELNLKVSYKPQYPSAEFEGTVESLLREAVGKFDAAFEPEVLIPLGVDPLLEKEVGELSGGELQRVAIAACIGKPADLYLLDEPSAYLDAEQRLMTAKVIKRVVEKKDTAGLVVDHDLLTLDFISDRMLVFTGEPGKMGETRGPMEMRKGMNLFLREVGVTFRRDPHTGRPRANKLGSRLDQEQKKAGEYFYI